MLGKSKIIRINLVLALKPRNLYLALMSYPWLKGISNIVRTRTTYLRTEIRLYMRCIHLHQKTTRTQQIITRISGKFQISKCEF